MTLSGLGWRIALALALAGVLSGTARAASCSVAAAPLLFGPYDTVAAAGADSTSTLVVECTTALGEPATVGYTILLADVAGTRVLRNAMHGLAYTLHYDAARTLAWGDGAAFGAGLSDAVQTTAALVPAARTHYVYGRIGARQIVPPGQYASAIVVTVEY